MFLCFPVPDGRRVVRKNQELQEALTLMNEYFGNKGNYRMLAEDARPEAGQVYGLEVSTGRFQRVLVRSVEGTGAETVVAVTHMDYGGQSSVAASRLLHLPEPLTRLAPSAVEVYCCRLQPWDGAQEWPPQASATAHRLFFRRELVGRVRGQGAQTAGILALISVGTKLDEVARKQLCRSILPSTCAEHSIFDVRSECRWSR